MGKKVYFSTPYRSLEFTTRFLPNINLALTILEGGKNHYISSRIWFQHLRNIEQNGNTGLWHLDYADKTGLVLRNLESGDEALR